MKLAMRTVATVHFQARANEILFDELVASADRAGVPWHVACKVAARLLLHTCRCAAQAQLKVMCAWSPEQWAAEREVAEVIDCARNQASA